MTASQTIRLHLKRDSQTGSLYIDPSSSQIPTGLHIEVTLEGTGARRSETVTSWTPAEINPRLVRRY